MQNILLYIYIVAIGLLLLSCTISKGRDPSTYRIPSPRALWQRVRAPRPIAEAKPGHQQTIHHQSEQLAKSAAADARSESGVPSGATTVKAVNSAERRQLLEHPSVVSAQRKLEELGYPIKIGGRWPSGLPFLNQVSMMVY